MGDWGTYPNDIDGLAAACERLGESGDNDDDKFNSICQYAMIYVQ